MEVVILVVLILFLVIDIAFFMATPVEFRIAGRWRKRWWRFLPGGGIAVYIAYKTTKEQQHER